MRTLVIWLILLTFTPLTFSQSKPVLEDKGHFGLHIVNDHIRWHRYIEDKNQLLLVGYRNLQLIDLTTFKVIETRPIDLPILNMRRDYYLGNWVLSPDGRYLLMLGLKDARDKTKDTQAAVVLDLQTGKRVKVLDRPEHVHRVWWSRNGKTLLTLNSANLIDALTKHVDVGIWDGQTFEYRNTIAIDNPTWIYLSDDGERFLAASGKTKNLLGIKYVSDSDFSSQELDNAKRRTRENNPDGRRGL